MQIRVELVAGRVEGDDAVPGQDLFDSALRQLDALVQADEVGVGLLGGLCAGDEALGGDGAEGEVQDVDLGDEVLGKGLERKVFRLLLLADRDLLQVLKVGQCPQAGVLSGEERAKSCEARSGEAGGGMRAMSAGRASQDSKPTVFLHVP